MADINNINDMVSEAKTAVEAVYGANVPAATLNGAAIGFITATLNAATGLGGGMGPLTYKETKGLGISSTIADTVSYSVGGKMEATVGYNCSSSFSVKSELTIGIASKLNMSAETAINVTRKVEWTPYKSEVKMEGKEEGLKKFASFLTMGAYALKEEKKLTEVEKVVAKAEEKIASSQVTIASKKDEIADLDQKLGKLYTQQASLSSSILMRKQNINMDEVKKNIETITSSISNIKSEIETRKSEISTIESNMTKLNNLLVLK